MQRLDSYLRFSECIQPVSGILIAMVNWNHRCQSLERVVLTCNNIDCIPPPTANSPILKSLQHLSLNSNNLQSWRDIDALSFWCPSLTSLATIGNPLVESESKYFNHRADKLKKKKYKVAMKCGILVRSSLFVYPHSSS